MNSFHIIKIKVNEMIADSINVKVEQNYHDEQNEYEAELKDDKVKIMKVK